MSWGEDFNTMTDMDLFTDLGTLTSDTDNTLIPKPLQDYFERISMNNTCSFFADDPIVPEESDFNDQNKVTYMVSSRGRGRKAQFFCPGNDVAESSTNAGNIPHLLKDMRVNNIDFANTIVEKAYNKESPNKSVVASPDSVSQSPKPVAVFKRNDKEHKQPVRSSTNEIKDNIENVFMQSDSVKGPPPLSVILREGKKKHELAKARKDIVFKETNNSDSTMAVNRTKLSPNAKKQPKQIRTKLPTLVDTSRDVEDHVQSASSINNGHTYSPVTSSQNNSSNEIPAWRRADTVNRGSNTLNPTNRNLNGWPWGPAKLASSTVNIKSMKEFPSLSKR